MKRTAIILLLLLIALPVFWVVANAASPGPDLPILETPQPSEEEQEISAVENAIYEKIEQVRQNTIFFWNQTITVEGTQVSGDGSWAASLLVPVNPGTGEIPETEPALAISVEEDGEWKPLLPNDPGWLEAVENSPDDLLSTEHKDVLLAMNINQAANVPTAAVSGYLLPWEAGEPHRKYLTGSTCHDEYVESGNAHYAFDFAYNGTMWDILAAKAGEVWIWKDNVPTCYQWTCYKDQPVGNYIVLRDTSTVPVTYQLYLHLKQNSIPDEIKIKGYQIAQGQYIGNVDNTGQSFGSHLHFQVQVPYIGENYFWGRSVDIKFSDVSINSGRPRIQDKNYCLDFNFCDKPGDVCKASQLYYTSQNQRVYPQDSTPPVGDILNPLTGETYTSSLSLEGWASDLGDGNETASGLQSAQFIAFFEGGWHDVGPEFDNLIFNYDWDWCETDVPDGPVSVALRISDNRGNQTPGLPGLRHVTKQYSCVSQPAPPGCQPNDDQAAIFSDINYQGDCQILGTGDYASSTDFNIVGDDGTHSILVGANVQAELFTEPNFQGRNEILQKNDSNLSDNPTANGTLSSIIISPRSTSQTGNSITALNKTTILGNSSSVLNATFTAAYSTTFESGSEGWTTGQDSLWHISTTNAHSGNYSWRFGINATNNYDNGVNSGFLESPLINLPRSSDPYVLQFWYRYQTESDYTHWDQRSIQISVDGGPYLNAFLLADDPELGWLRTRIDLLPYYDINSDHTVQVRFMFDTIDAYNNKFEGWFIDDFQIQTQPATAIACPDDLYEPNDLPTTAFAKKLAYGKTAEGVICSGWDLDFFRFQGAAGDRVVVDIDAKTINSNLDSYLFLLDTDGHSELAENDDEILYTKQDPLLGYMLPRDGEYYLKLKAWDHPMGTGEYRLKLINDHQNPTITLLNPVEGSSLPVGDVTLTAQATDEGSGVQYVRFLVHDNNWETGKWVEIGTDFDDSDGWNIVFDTSSFPDGETLSIYAVAYDWAGNWDHDAAWHVLVDETSLITQIQDLPVTTQSTAIRVQWSISGGGAETSIINLQVRVNNGSWNDLLTNTKQTEYWFIGEAGNTYNFRVSASDYAGNTSTSQTRTSIPEASILCSQPDAWDINNSDNDNSYNQATMIAVNRPSQLHNFCNPIEGSSYLNDQDWISFVAEKEQSYRLTALPYGDKSIAVTIRLFAKDGTTLIAEKAAEKYGNKTELFWRSNQSGPVFIQLRHNNGKVAGNEVSYRFYLSEGSIFMPVINR